MRTCFKCQAPVTEEKVFFRDECRSCGADLHVCFNCEFYDPGKSNKCREPQADYVSERDRSNVCEYFRFKDSSAKPSAKADAEKLWQDLFKK
jgi:hypothetical protein